MLARSGLITAPCGVAPFRRPVLKTVQHVLLQVGLDQGQNPAVRHFSLNELHEPRLRDMIKEAFNVRIHHYRVFRFEPGIYLTQSVLATASGTEAVTVFGKVPFEDRFHHVSDRSLHHPVPHSRNAQRPSFLGGRALGIQTRLIALGRYVPSFSSRWQTGQILFQASLEHLDGLVVHSGASPIRLHLGKGRSKVAHFVRPCRSG